MSLRRTLRHEAAHYEFALLTSPASNGALPRRPTRCLLRLMTS